MASQNCQCALRIRASFGGPKTGLIRLKNVYFTRSYLFWLCYQLFHPKSAICRLPLALHGLAWHSFGFMPDLHLWRKVGNQVEIPCQNFDSQPLKGDGARGQALGLGTKKLVHAGTHMPLQGGLLAGTWHTGIVQRLPRDA